MKPTTTRLVIAVVASMPLVARGADEPDGARWWSHVTFLADDRLEGRDTGSAGHREAAEYVAGHFARAGLRPAGTDGYLQPVKFQSREIDEAHSSLSFVENGREQPLTLGEDAIISLRVDPAVSVEADLVFAGYGLSNAEAGHDDFQGLDVHGKIVVYLMRRPTSIPAPWPPICSPPASTAPCSESWVPRAHWRSRIPRTSIFPGAIRPRPVHALDEPRRPRA